MQRIPLLIFFVVSLLAPLGAKALAQDASPPQAQKPQAAANPAPAKASPVIVEHSGSDPVGTALANACKETFAKSALFRVSKADERKIVVSIQSKEEFPDRPKMASMVTVLWLFSAQDGTLRFYLQSDTYSVDAAGVDDSVNRILAKTDSVSTTYKSLFE